MAPHRRAALLLPVLCVACARPCAAAPVQRGGAPEAARDSVRTAPRDSLIARRDTLRRYAPMTMQPARGADTVLDPRLLVEHELQETADALAWSAALFPQSFLTPGRPAELVVDGLDTRALSVTIGGRPFNDPLTGRAAVLDIAPAFSEAALATRAPHGAVAGEGIAALAFVPRIHNTNEPYVCVRYEQAPAEYIGSDLAFSQNLARPLNLAVGVTRESQTGAFLNTGLQYWNVRGAVRWFPDSTLNLLLTENFTHNHAGENGGLVPDDLAVITSQARVNLSAAEDDVVRHDLTLAARWQANGDSTLATEAQAFVSTIDREFVAQDDPVLGPVAFPFRAEDLRQSSTWYGATVRQVLSRPGMNLDAGLSTFRMFGGAGYALAPVSETHVGAFVDAGLQPWPWFGARAFGRLDRIGVIMRPTLGVELEAVDASARLVLGAATTERIPTPQERAWLGPVVVGAVGKNERHLAAYAGLRVRAPGLALAVDASARTINGVIEPQIRDSVFAIVNGPMRHVWSASAQVQADAGHVEVVGIGVLTVERENGVQLERLPVAYGRFGLYYRNPRFLGVPLEVKAGLEGWGTGPFVGERVLPASGFAVPAIDRRAQTNGAVDWIVMVHLGSAYLRVGVQNFFGRHVYLVPYYPELAQTFHLGVTWALYD